MTDIVRGDANELLQLMLTNLSHMLNGNNTAVRQISIIPSESDNEIIFEILLNLFVGFMALGQLPQVVPTLQELGSDTMLTSPDSPHYAEFMEMLRATFSMVGFVPNVKILTNEDASNLIAHTYIRNNRFELASLHPIRIMDRIAPTSLPQIFTDFFEKKEYLPNILALKKVENDRTMVISFNVANVPGSRSA